MKKWIPNLCLFMLPLASAMVAPLQIIYLKDYQAREVKLPITNPHEAIHAALNLEDVKKEISVAGQWWITASAYDPVNYKGRWVVVIGNGEGECGSPHQCVLHLNQDGTVALALHCSDDWNCK